MLKKIIVDTNCFIKYPLELANLATENQLVTTTGVLGEAKDKATRESVLLRFPNLKTLRPSKSSIDYVVNFAHKTGDFISLSQVDLEIIALAYEIIKNDKQAIRSSPQPKRVLKGGQESQIENDNRQIEEANVPINNNQMITGQNEKDDLSKIDDEKKSSAVKEKGLSGWGYFDSDDEEGWLGSQNISELKIETMAKTDAPEILCSVMTEDFAMQNIILQAGIPLISIEGKRIKKLKSYVMECYSCLTVNRQNNLLFCKQCGKKTLLKVTCEFLLDGSFVLYKKKNRQPVVRGNRYPIPEPKGGKKVIDMIQHEDDFMQPKVQRYVKILEKATKRDNETFQRNLDFESDFNSNANLKGKLKALKVGHGNKNPNVGFGKRR